MGVGMLWLTLLLPEVNGASPYLASLCKGHYCSNIKFPLLDYNPREGKCICSAHPCWEDGNTKHTCSQPGFPFLSFWYDDNHVLKCGCSKHSHVSSTYVSKELCAGNRCEGNEHPVLDWDPVQQKCVCMAHPCWNDNGVKHECNPDTSPILTMRMELDGRKVCECRRNFAQTGEEL